MRGTLAQVRFLSFLCFFACSSVRALFDCCGKLYSGQDNPSTLCIVGDVPNIFVGNLGNHDGPCAGITMGC